MTLAQGSIAYFICWWLFFLMALPIGIEPQQEYQKGLERAAPRKTRLVIKCACATMLAALGTWAIDFVIHSGIVAVK